MFLREKFPFTSTHKTLLRQQIIDAHHPGPILADFQHLLDFVGADGLPATASGLLTLKLLKPLNDRLTRSLRLGLSRPQQKSFPHINGLYLLLRTTGLGQFEPTAKPPRLVIDPVVLSSWSGLNPTEQYLTLLETWLLRGRAEVIGEEHGSSWRNDSLGGWTRFFASISTEGLAIAGDKVQVDSLRYRPGWHNLALLELFGLVRIADGPPVKGEGWQIERIWRTPLGDAWLACLHHLPAVQIDELLMTYDEPSEIPFGIWRPALQAYFPAWQQTLTFPPVEFQEGVLIFKVSLWQDKVWRRLAIPGHLTLEELATAILHAFNFDSDHLYRFSYTNRFGATGHVVHPYMEESPATTEVQVGELALRVGAALEFVYDFGDWWKFTLTLEQIEPPNPRQTTVELLAEHGQAPPQYEWDDADIYENEEGYEDE